MFKKDDIKPGYLARFTCTKDNPVYDVGETFYATAFTCRDSFNQEKVVLVAKSGDKSASIGIRASELPDTLETGHFRLDAVFGPTLPHMAYRNDTSGRVLLWKRETAKRMTLEEVEKALGHPVELVTDANK